MLQRTLLAINDDAHSIVRRHDLPNNTRGNVVLGKRRKHGINFVWPYGENECPLADCTVRINGKQLADLGNILPDNDLILHYPQANLRCLSNLHKATKDTTFGCIMHRGDAIITHTNTDRRHGISNHAHLPEECLRLFGELLTIGRSKTIRECHSKQSCRFNCRTFRHNHTISNLGHCWRHIAVCRANSDDSCSTNHRIVATFIPCSMASNNGNPQVSTGPVHRCPKDLQLLSGDVNREV